MFRISRIQELLKPISRGQFDQLVHRHHADKHVKRFGAWDQLVAMVYAQLSGVRSLRELQAGFNAQRTHHYHLRSAGARRSTLAEANMRRSPEVFAELARSLMGHAERSVRHSCRELLYLLDSTSITLQGRGFDEWTADNRTCHTQGVKLHLVLEAHAKTPTWHSITAPNVNDRDEGLRVKIQPAATYVFDKGYYDYNWWASIHAQGARFVTRYKRNAALTPVQELAVPLPQPGDGAILSDQVVRFTHKSPRGGKRNLYTQPLRRIEVSRGDLPALVLATNDLNAPASVIAQLYKDRWQVELFFKWIKQHLNIRNFLGRSENAVKIQILTALITYLLLQLYRRTHGLGATLWALLCELRATLFQRPGVEAAAYQRRRTRQLETAALQPGLFG